MSNTFLALIFAIASSWVWAAPLWAQASKRPIYPKGFEATADWQYSCPDGKGCSFNCPGSGGANNVTHSLASFWDQFRLEILKVCRYFL